MIKPGGYALKHLKCKRISREDIPATLEYLSVVLNIPVADMQPIGSTGKTQTSGDIDLVVDQKQHTVDNLKNKLITSFGKEAVEYNFGTKVLSVAVPIAGDCNKGLVQVDFMVTDYPDWATFAYYSSTESNYKGAIRNILLMSLATTINQPGIDCFVFEGDLLVVRIGRTFDLNKGVRRIMQHRPVSLKSNKRLKNMQTVDSFDAMTQMYPFIDVAAEVEMITDPTQAIQLLFRNDTLTAADALTTEQVLDLLNTLPNKIKEQTVEIARQKASTVKNKMVLPSELS